MYEVVTGVRNGGISVRDPAWSGSFPGNMREQCAHYNSQATLCSCRTEMMSPGISVHPFSDQEHSLVKMGFGEMVPALRGGTRKNCCLSTIIFRTAMETATGTDHKRDKRCITLLFWNK